MYYAIAAITVSSAPCNMAAEVLLVLD